jgi:hypothetical protein
VPRDEITTNQQILKMALADLRSQIEQAEQALQGNGAFSEIELLPSARAAQEAIKNLQQLQQEASSIDTIS